MVLTLAAALAVGLAVGLLGAGGSLLCVPILTVLGGQPEKVAIAESVLLAGWVGLVALLAHGRWRLVDGRTFLLFGPPGALGSWAGASLSRLVPGSLQLLLLALTALTSALLLVRSRGVRPAGREAGERVGEAGGDPVPCPAQRRLALRALVALVLLGVAVGVLTGLLGVGGGFLVVPALVLVARLPVPVAIGTSLALLVVKSAVASLTYGPVLSSLGMEIDWRVTGLFAVLATVGGLAGGRLAVRLPEVWLQRAFAGLLVVVGGVLTAAALPGLL